MLPLTKKQTVSYIYKYLPKIFVLIQQSRSRLRQEVVTTVMSPKLHPTLDRSQTQRGEVILSLHSSPLPSAFPHPNNTPLSRQGTKLDNDNALEERGTMQCYKLEQKTTKNIHSKHTDMCRGVGRQLCGPEASIGIMGKRICPAAVVSCLG